MKIYSPKQKVFINAYSLAASNISFSCMILQLKEKNIDERILLSLQLCLQTNAITVAHLLKDFNILTEEFPTEDEFVHLLSLGGEPSKCVEYYKFLSEKYLTKIAENEMSDFSKYNYEGPVQ